MVECERNKKTGKGGTAKMRILIVEDDTRLGDTLRELLQENDYETDLIADGTEGLDYALDSVYGLIILDVMLPGMNGREIVSRMRRQKVNTPVLMLTARDEPADKIAGLDAGADDYLTKPFHAEELLARIRALSRRKGEVIMNALECGDLSLNLSLKQLECKDKAVRLGSKEFEIMQLLLQETNRVVTKEEIIVRVWSYDAEVEDNNVEVYISFLRKKLKFLQTNVRISTARKMGYFLEITPEP